MRRGREIGLVAKAAVAYYLTLHTRALCGILFSAPAEGARHWASDLRPTP